MLHNRLCHLIVIKDVSQHLQGFVEKGFGGAVEPAVNILPQAGIRTSVYNHLGVLIQLKLHHNLNCAVCIGQSQVRGGYQNQLLGKGNKG